MCRKATFFCRIKSLLSQCFDHNILLSPKISLVCTLWVMVIKCGDFYTILYTAYTWYTAYQHACEHLKMSLKLKVSTLTSQSLVHFVISLSPLILDAMGNFWHWHFWEDSTPFFLSIWLWMDFVFPVWMFSKDLVAEVHKGIQIVS